MLCQPEEKCLSATHTAWRCLQGWESLTFCCQQPMGCEGDAISGQQGPWRFGGRGDGLEVGGPQELVEVSGGGVLPRVIVENEG